MINSEINEIKSLFDSVSDQGIYRLTGCYVNGEKQKVKTFSEHFYDIPEEEMHKYLEVFRKTLSGTPGKNLLDMSFVDQVEDESFMGKSLLKKILRSKLEDNSALDTFYDMVIENYNYVGNYLILLIFQSYDVPGITTDGVELDDASEEIYSYMLCSICPMKLTKPGLGFDDDLGEIHTLKQLFAVELPENGFLYPAFNDRSTDETGLLYFCKKADILQDTLLEKVLGVPTTLPAKQQKEGFTEFVSDVLGDEADFETVLSIHENLKDTVHEIKAESAGNAVFFDKDTMRGVFERSGVSEERLEQFDRRFDEQFDMERIHSKQNESVKIDDGSDYSPARDYVPTLQVEEKLFADNVAPTRSLEVRNKNMVLRVNTNHTDIIEARIIDGRKCLVIEVTDDLTVNGVPVEG
ncbi:MAG: DUF4317 domain-containing protein [Eubacterium sp.]|nr:DUF4317 domain-containing protein [Eubacterium sp.]